MRVTDVDVIPLEHSLPEGKSLGSSRGKTPVRFATLLRITTADGTVGWGEAFAPPRTVATLVEESLANTVVGTDPYEVESLAERTYTGSYHFGGGPMLQSAVSGIDMALWDIIGQATGKPIHELIGGRRTESVTPYASTMYVTEWGQEPAEPIEAAVEEGFTAAKIKIGRGIDDDVERVATARDLLGEDAYLMVDYNGNYRPKQVIRSVEALSEYDLTWVEEPVPPENITGYRQLRDRIDVPIAAGEAHYGRFQFNRLIEDRTVDIVQPNLGRCGGFSEARRIADAATGQNVAVRPHVWNSGVGVAAALQYIASLPEYPHSEYVPEPPLFEFDRSENPLRHEILQDPFDPTGGSLSVPEGPGLGIKVDEEAVERYRVNDVGWAE